MKTFKKSFFLLTKHQRYSLFTLLLLLFVLEMAWRIFPIQASPRPPTYSADVLLALEKRLDSIQTTRMNAPFSSSRRGVYDSLRPFNPNMLSIQGWERMGFTRHQAASIVKYKQFLGGQFKSKEEIQRCFVISDEAFQAIAPFITLPERTKKSIKEERKQMAKRIDYHSFNPNNYTLKQWQAIGFTSKQAATILKYKAMLGGEFTTKEQLKKCFVIAELKYKEMEPYISIPPPIKTDVTHREGIELPMPHEELKFNPNHLDLNGWMALGFTERQATTILNFKKSLGGRFKDAKTLKRAYSISDEKFKELLPRLIFE